MQEKIIQALTSLFEKHRIVIWYDEKKEFDSGFAGINPGNVKKLRLDNNEFAIKQQLLIKDPDSRYLVYKAGARPENIGNWLLDIELANAVFSTDQSALLLNELELGPEYAEITTGHSFFFGAATRKNALKELLDPRDSLARVRMKMLAVIAGSSPDLEAIIAALLKEHAENRNEIAGLLEKCGLNRFFWSEIRRDYDYDYEKPNIKDFALRLFLDCFNIEAGIVNRAAGQKTLAISCIPLLKSWKDNWKNTEAFKSLARRYEEDLEIEKRLEAIPLKKKIGLDYFEVIERSIIRELVSQVDQNLIGQTDCAEIIRLRKESFWYNNYAEVYNAIKAASEFFAAIDGGNFTAQCLNSCFNLYADSWYRIDQLFRQYIRSLRACGYVTLLACLTVKIENRYINSFLAPLYNCWLSLQNDCWKFPAGIKMQNRFFAEYPGDYLKNGRKMVVIISDAMRYEVGEELCRSINRQDKYEAGLDRMLTLLPSYTQLGMAALLPHDRLLIKDKNTVLVDDMPSAGTENRKKILQARVKKSLAIEAESITNMAGPELKELVRDHDLIYIYHDLIDSVGDKRDTQDRVFEAVENTVEELVKLVKKLMGSNVSSIAITADHGFLYQNKPLQDEDYADDELEGDEILAENRRFIMGKGLVESESVKKYTSAQIGLAGDFEMLIPNSLFRLRKRGSGDRFVHGGATLQETVIPVIKVKKKRESDTDRVGIKILREGSSTISTGQFGLKLYQEEPVSEKKMPVTLRIGLYSHDNVLISNQREITFNSTAASPRERETVLSLVLNNRSGEYEKTQVFLRLEEQCEGTSHFKTQTEEVYFLKKKIDSDFDQW